MSESVNEPLAFTGERFLPERGGEIWYEHWHRYALARQLGRNCAVLDVACGEGYGSAMLSEVADKVVGVDISPDAIRHAMSRYGQHANLEFVEASCDKLPFPDASFDVAVSFETIEHIETQKEFIAELTRVLRPDGVLILSSPNKRLYSDAHDYHNEFHVRELYRNELEELLLGAFPHIDWFGQKLLFHSAIWPENRDCPTTEYLIDAGQGVVAVNNPSIEPMYYLVVCSRVASMLPATLHKLSLFSDTSETVYRDYATQTRRVMELDRLLIERDDTLSLRTQQMTEREKLIAERDSLLVLRTEQIDQGTAQIAERDAQIAERDALLILRTEQFEQHVQQIVERDALLALRTGQMEERERMIAERDTRIDQTVAQIAEHERLIEALNQQLAYRAGWTWWLKSPLRLIKRALQAND